MKSGGKLLFKCRMCGETYGDVHAPDILAALVAIHVHGVTPPEWGIPVSATDVHTHTDGSYGMADLIGAKPDEPKAVTPEAA